MAKLEPVQTVAVRTEGQQIVMETDTKNEGRGRTVEEAIKDLEERTPGVIYLDTAQYLLLTKETEEYGPALRDYMRPTVKVSLWDGKGSVETAAQYLDVQRDLPLLKEVGSGK